VVTIRQAPITAPFVKSSGTLKVRYDEEHGDEYSGWYLDQGAIVFNGFVSPLVRSPFAATTATVAVAVAATATTIVAATIVATTASDVHV
jgi:hypothetical protein